MNSSNAQASSRLKLDFIVIGNQNAGKTSLIKSFCCGEGTVRLRQARSRSRTPPPSA